MGVTPHFARVATLARSRNRPSSDSADLSSPVLSLQRDCNTVIVGEAKVRDTMTATDVKAIRERLGLTQEELADRMGVTHAAICMWERGKRTPSGMAVHILRTLDEPKKNRKS